MLKRFICTILIIFIACFGAGCGTKTKFDAPSGDENPVAEMTIFAFNGDSERIFGLINLGHAFVTIKNVSDNAIFIGSFELLPSNEVSVGTWGMNAHWGIWYNVESTYMTIGRYDGRISLTQGISTNDIKDINDYLAVNDKWTPFKNCSYFAVDLWNLSSSANDTIDINGLVTPGKVYNRVISTVGYASNRKTATFNKVGYGALSPNLTSNGSGGFTEFIMEEVQK